MRNIRYGSTSDAKWIAMVAPGCVLVLEAGQPGDRIEELWFAVSSKGTVQTVLDGLTRGGISTTPDFLLATFAADLSVEPFALSVLVRGSSAASIHSVSGEIDLTGEGVSTWVERTVPDATGLEFGASGLSSASKARRSFVLGSGTAPVSWFSLGAHSETKLPAPVAAPAVIAQPAVEVVVETIADPGITISEAFGTEADSSTPPAGEEAAAGYDYLFGETVKRTVEDAAVRGDSAMSAGDHDGKTSVGLSASERRAARAARQAKGNPPRPASTPAIALVLSTGEREVLDQGLIIGRAPSASKVSASSVPRLVTVGGPDQDISRNHVQVMMEGGTVMVTDLHSRNGTVLTLPDRPPQQLRGGQPTAVLVGAVVDLGSGISFTVVEN